MIILGHRGALGYAPQNTMASFKKAVEQQCDGVETDVQLTKDNELVIFHDWDVSYNTNGEGLIKDLSLDYIKTLDAGGGFEGKYAGERVPTLEEVLDFLPRSMILNIEIKSMADDIRGIEEKVISMLEKKDRIKNTVISSFNHDVLKRIRNISRDVEIALLYIAYLSNPIEYMDNNGFNIYSCHPKIEYVNKEMIRLFHERNVKVIPWIINDPESIKKCLEYGADGITTDSPLKTKEYLNNILNP